jgi:hypothetical protein
LLNFPLGNWQDFIDGIKFNLSGVANDSTWFPYFRREQIWGLERKAQRALLVALSFT